MPWTCGRRLGWLEQVARPVTETVCDTPLELNKAV